MQATLLTEWQCSLLNLLKIWVQHVKTIPGNHLLTVKMILQIEHFEGNYGNKL